MTHRPEDGAIPTPETLAQTLDAVWHGYMDAREHDQTQPDINREQLILYPGEDPRERIVVLPVWGAQDVSRGPVRIAHYDGRKQLAALVLFRSPEPGRSFVTEDDPRNRSIAYHPVDSSQERLAVMQANIAGSSPIRPPKRPGRLMRALGASAQG